MPWLLGAFPKYKYQDALEVQNWGVCIFHSSCKVDLSWMVKLYLLSLALMGAEPCADRRFWITNGKHLFSSPKYCFLQSGFLISDAWNPRLERTDLMPRQMRSCSWMWLFRPREVQKRTIIHSAFGRLFFFPVLLWPLWFFHFFFFIWEFGGCGQQWSGATSVLCSGSLVAVVGGSDVMPGT